MVETYNKRVKDLTEENNQLSMEIYRINADLDIKKSLCEELEAK